LNRLITDAGATMAHREDAATPAVADSLTLWQQIREDWQAHGCDWTKPGFRAVAVHRLGAWQMHLSSPLLRVVLGRLYRSLYCKVRNRYGIDLPSSVQLGRRVIFEHQGSIVIHANSVIGDDCIIRQGVALGYRYRHRPDAAPRLGERVNVGAGAKILGDITIGSDVNIGANAVVLTDIPPGQTAVGIPARLVSVQPAQL
jgi:serine O-acetyltransferase